MPPSPVTLVQRGFIYATVTLTYIYSFKSLISSFYPKILEMVWRAKEEITLFELNTQLKVCGVWGCSTGHFDLLLFWKFLYNILDCIKSFVLHGHKYKISYICAAVSQKLACFFQFNSVILLFFILHWLKNLDNTVCTLAWYMSGRQYSVYIWCHFPQYLREFTNIEYKSDKIMKCLHTVYYLKECHKHIFA